MRVLFRHGVGRRVPNLAGAAAAGLLALAVAVSLAACGQYVAPTSAETEIVEAERVPGQVPTATTAAFPTATPALIPTPTKAFTSTPVPTDMWPMPPTPTAIPAGFTKFILDPCTRPPGTSDTELRAKLEALEWFGDNPSSGDQSLDEDVAVWEEDTIEVLERMLAQCPKVFRAVVASEWMRNDELDTTWARMVSANYILQIARVDEQSAVAILELPFLRAMEPLDGFTLEFLRDVFRTDPYEGRRLIADPTIGDPATASLPTDFYLSYLRLEGPAVSQALDSIRWIGDGVDPFWDPMKNYRDINSSYEADALQNLTILYLKSPEAFLSLARRPWLQESISPDNYTALSNVLDFAYDSPEISARVAEMAFLDTFEEGDLMIVQTMLEIADNDPGRLEEILANPELADGLVHGRR